VKAERAADRLHRRLWVGAITLLAAMVAVRNVVDLSGSPPGLYVDEASIGYNAWTIAHFGVDEHGIHFPLFFQAFGEYKNPIYVYAVAALVRFLPLTVAVERFPAALFGGAVVGFLTAAAWRLTGSRVITIGTLALVGFTPWLVIESRVGFGRSRWLRCSPRHSGACPAEPRRLASSGSPASCSRLPSTGTRPPGSRSS
jgi:hypothetical protein